MSRKRHRQRKGSTGTLAPTATPPSPDGGHGPRNVLLLGQHQAGVRVNEDTALTLGAVFACTRVIAEGLSVLPWQVFERLPTGGRQPCPEDPSDWLLHFQANPETSAFAWRETIIAHALLWGNGYAEIERDGAGRPVWLWQLTPERVEVERANAGYTSSVVYRVRNPSGDDTILDAADVFHLRGLGFDGLQGYPVVRLAARTIGLGMALDEASASILGNDATPGGYLKHPGRLTDKARENLRDSWQRRHGGPSNRRTLAVLEEGLTWEQMGLAPEDLQLLTQRQYTPAEVCRWFRVQPHKIADLARATFSNIEQQSIEHVVDTLLPWARRLESEADIKLFGRNTRRQRFTRFNLLALLRGDSTSRASYFTQMLDRGIYSINEVREQEDLNPIPGGDLRTVQLNMQTLEAANAPPEKANEPAKPDTAAEDSPQADADEEAAEGEDMAGLALRPVLADALERIQQRAKGRSRSNGQAELREYAHKALLPAASALARLTGGTETAADTAVTMFLDAGGADPDDLIARTLAASAASRLFNPDQPRDDHGRFGEGGDGEKKKGKEGDSAGQVADQDRREKAQQPVDSARKANKWGTENVHTEGGMKPEEVAAFKSYQSTSLLINKSLRAGKPSKEAEVERDIQNIDAAMQRSTIQEDVVVRRGISGPMAVLGFKEGVAYQDRGFVSTTLNTETAKRFSGVPGVLCEILIPKGSRGVYLKGRGECEIVLDRGSLFHVHSVRKEKGVTHVQMTLGMQGITFGDDRGRKKQSWQKPGFRLEADEITDDGMSGDPARFEWQEGDLVEYAGSEPKTEE